MRGGEKANADGCAGLTLGETLGREEGRKRERREREKCRLVEAKRTTVRLWPCGYVACREVFVHTERYRSQNITTRSALQRWGGGHKMF